MIYGSQTKIWEEGTKDENRIFEVLLAGVSTRYGRRTIEKSIENPHFIICSSVQNLRLGTMKFQSQKSRFPIYRACLQTTHESDRPHTVGTWKPRDVISTCCYTVLYVLFLIGCPVVAQ